ncbi:hypothetical protein CAPTEDRAFT_217806 [Capitella teleta]|uniref:Uncharacterized protein n=1 Tax=Capitella teleta TaxID=283909 RepID=R7TU36_CAPTE|nr:hypothetical protein CAPTEDRAFT_217806 [Capitella teleta]|eukprot:ELT94971.1 hypothetical protein CAPTEDRAFT_217806 [Capitella teleta]
MCSEKCVKNTSNITVEELPFSVRVNIGTIWCSVVVQLASNTPQRTHIRPQTLQAKSNTAEIGHVYGQFRRTLIEEGNVKTVKPSTELSGVRRKPLNSILSEHCILLLLCNKREYFLRKADEKRGWFKECGTEDSNSVYCSSSERPFEASATKLRHESVNTPLMQCKLFRGTLLLSWDRGTTWKKHGFGLTSSGHLLCYLMVK